VASKYIDQLQKKTKKITKACERLDPVLSEGRPALTDFMTEMEGQGGKEREPSALMICASSEGLRVGLKDEEMGGWLWRQGESLKGCLDAIEEALAGGTAKFGGAKARRK
jgi:hypothetical protein